MSGVKAVLFMENIIEELLRIEEHASEFLAGAEERRKEESARMREQLREFKDSLDAQTQGRIRKLTKESEEKMRTLLAELEREGEGRLKRMEVNFAENRGKWQEQLIQRVLYSNN